jgi:retron-type reverse transcriptase
VAEIYHFASRSYEWIVEGDIKACFDEISHSALMDRVRKRIGGRSQPGMRPFCHRYSARNGSLSTGSGSSVSERVST